MDPRNRVYNPGIFNHPRQFYHRIILAECIDSLFVVFCTGGTLATEHVQFEVLASQPLFGAVHELVVSFNGNVLQRRECSGADAPHGRMRVCIPVPKEEGVIQVSVCGVLLAIELLFDCNRVAVCSCLPL